MPLGPAQVTVLELPTLPGDDPPVLAHLAVFANPWPGAMTVWRSLDDGASYQPFATIAAPAVMGETLDDLTSGPTSRWDKVATARVKLSGGALASASDLRVLSGANAAAVQRPDGAWEILQFANAVLVGGAHLSALAAAARRAWQRARHRRATRRRCSIRAA